MMNLKSAIILIAIQAICVLSISAFTAVSVPQTGLKSSSSLHAYVPDGLTAAEYQKIKAQDRKNLGKDLGRLGPRGFKSRSMQAWQEAFERGEAGHTFAPFGYRAQLKKGEIKDEDVPYMVRGGSWDNGDVFGAKRLPWLKTDKEYARGGYKKEQSASIIGSGAGFNWTGERNEAIGNVKKIVPGLS
ncbi:expressed unknown protein [Seminavis robusta]|uniref:Uncharacterized protein n=1 Tax=Seminavis robusta TaxID=568900 RepID=A0A9N8DB02_9STRA|nr:expressed unknown protein [Seminavis robusta]|eukprot:Sro4_g003890.1 n/a (187) ;mRNA; r:270854-271414